MADRRVELTRETKKRFVSMLLRVARAYEGISRQERTFIRQFWRKLQRLWQAGYFLIIPMLPGSSYLLVMVVPGR